MAAEISTMKVTEQIDAMKVLGVDPFEHIIAPRVFAGFFIMPFVIILANLLGIAGGMFISKLAAELNVISYINSVWMGLEIRDMVSTMVKAFIFGGIISLTCTSVGYSTEGGAIDVGKSTTKAVVWSFVIILIVDYFISYLFYGGEKF
jgi:phospholipid/cholesterol/gamma-HCH transport system permease protein